MLRLWLGRVIGTTVIALTVLLPPGVVAQAGDLVARMAARETEMRAQKALYTYLSNERSERTGGRLWQEHVVETEDGPMRRLLAVDGHALTPAEAQREETRLAAIVADPAEFRRLNAARKDDEAHALGLLTLLPRAFVLSPAGSRDGCTIVAFAPDPRFNPSSYEERIIHAMAGTVAIKEPENRLCRLDARIIEPVQFGFGLFGRLNAGGTLMLARVPIDGPQWKTREIRLHVNGKVLLLKSLTREQETVRDDIHILPRAPSLAQALEMSR